MRRNLAAHPANEAARLTHLYNLGCLDTPLNPKIERIAGIATRIFGAHCALVTLIDRDRQWFKSRGTWNVSEIAREDAFCSHTILDSQVLVCQDTQRDPRFCQNPAVLGGPRVRFYAGAPLIAAEGIHLGAFCVLDTKPRYFTPEELDTLQETLRDMAAMVMDELRLEQSTREAKGQLSGPAQLPH